MNRPVQVTGAFSFLNALAHRYATRPSHVTKLSDDEVLSFRRNAAPIEYRVTARVPLIDPRDPKHGA